MHPPLLPSLRLCNIDHVVVWFDVARRDGQQLVYPYAGAPQHTHHEVVARAALVRRREHLINLFFFEVVGDVLHALPKMCLIGNNGCDFEPVSLLHSRAEQLVDKATILCPHAVKTENSEHRYSGS